MNVVTTTWMCPLDEGYDEKNSEQWVTGEGDGTCYLQMLIDGRWRPTPIWASTPRWLSVDEMQQIADALELPYDEVVVLQL